MFTRFKQNYSRYPRLFKVWMALCVLTVAYYFAPVLFALRAELIISLSLAGSIYLWITSNAGRTQILLDIINRFEGRDVCTIKEHTIEEEEQ